jgi:hypothetical protein
MLPPINNTVFVGGAASMIASQVVGSLVATVKLTIATNFSGAVGSCSVAASGSPVFNVYTMASTTNIQKLIGTITYPSGAYTPTFSTASGAILSLNAGDTLVVLAPSTVDSTLANVAFYIPNYSLLYTT